MKLEADTRKHRGDVFKQCNKIKLTAEHALDVELLSFIATAFADGGAIAVDTPRGKHVRLLHGLPKSTKVAASPKTRAKRK